MYWGFGVNFKARRLLTLVSKLLCISIRLRYTSISYNDNNIKVFRVILLATDAARSKKREGVQ